MNQPKLELYYFPSCPFCVRVLNLVDQMNFKIELKDIIENQDHRNFLQEKTGRTTVPCLFIDGDPMFESQDIMTWLTKNEASLEKA